MAKRFTDTELWDKEWFMKLTTGEKLAFKFIKDKCDLVGVWSPNLMLLNFLVGCEISLDELIDRCNGNLERLEDGKIFIPNFCRFQYGELTESCKPHKKYLEMLKSNGLFKRVCIGYTKGIDTLQDKDKEKDKDKDKENECSNFPTIDEVKAYILMEKLEVDYLVYFNNRNDEDWCKSNGKKVKNWKNDIQNCHRQGYFKSKPSEKSDDMPWVN